MNYIWTGMILVSLVSAAITGRMPETVNAVFEGSAAAVSVITGLAGAICFWTGIMKIAENSGIFELITRMLSAPVRFLFPNAGEKARRYVSMNMTANFLGMGNAATPMGIKAAMELDAENDDLRHPSNNQCMLAAINTAAVQLLPTTVISLRAAAGSANPVSVIVPVWLASAAAFTAAVVSVKLYGAILAAKSARMRTGL